MSPLSGRGRQRAIAAAVVVAVTVPPLWRCLRRIGDAGAAHRRVNPGWTAMGPDGDVFRPSGGAFRRARRVRPDADSRPLLTLAVDYLQHWPLDDIMRPGPPPEWASIITPRLVSRLTAWAAFFNDHVDYDTGLFASVELRQQFDREGVRLLHALRDQAGHLFRFRLRL